MLKPSAPDPGWDSPLARHSVPSVAVCTAFFATKGSWTSSEPQLRRSAVCCVSWDFYVFLVCQRVVKGWSPGGQDDGSPRASERKWMIANVSERKGTCLSSLDYEYLYDLSKFFGPRFCPHSDAVEKVRARNSRDLEISQLAKAVVPCGPFCYHKMSVVWCFCLRSWIPQILLQQQWFWRDSKSSLRWSIRWPCTLVVWSRKMPARLDGGELTPVEILPMILRYLKIGSMDIHG